MGNTKKKKTNQTVDKRNKLTNRTGVKLNSYTIDEQRTMQRMKAENFSLGDIKKALNLEVLPRTTLNSIAKRNIPDDVSLSRTYRPNRADHDDPLYKQFEKDAIDEFLAKNQAGSFGVRYLQLAFEETKTKPEYSNNVRIQNLQISGNYIRRVRKTHKLELITRKCDSVCFIEKI